MSIHTALKRGVSLAFEAVQSISTDLILTKRHVLDYDPVTGTPTSSESFYPFKGIFTSITADEVDDQLVATEVKRLLLENVDFVPEIGDVIVTKDNVEFEINKVTPIKPGDDAFLYRLVVYR